MEEIPVEGKMGGRIAVFSYLKVASTWIAFRGTSNCTVVLGQELTRLKSFVLNIKHVAATWSVQLPADVAFCMSMHSGSS